MLTTLFSIFIFLFFSAQYRIDYHCQCCVSSQFGPEPQDSLFSFWGCEWIVYYRPVLQWLNNDGSDIVVGDGISLDGPNSQSTLTTLALMFSALRTSHAGRYICRGSLTSPALSSPLVETADYNVSIQSELTSRSTVGTSFSTKIPFYGIFFFPQ